MAGLERADASEGDMVRVRRGSGDTHPGGVLMPPMLEAKLALALTFMLLLGEYDCDGKAPPLMLSDENAASEDPL